MPIVTKENFFSLLEHYQKGQIDTAPREGLGLCGDNADLIICKEHNSLCTIPTDTTFSKSFLWGIFNNRANRRALQIALRDNADLIFCELGMVFCYDKASPCSFVADRKGVFFDSSIVTDLENLINDKSVVISNEQCEESARLISKIVSNKITTYNNQPIKSVNIGRKGVRKVLIVDQNCNPQIDRLGKVDEIIFEKMLSAAERENPDADILIKTHPPTVKGARGYLDSIKTQANMFKIDYPINPYSLFEVCDKVYVGFSLMGFEALLARKEVHTFGMPFYAGWGLTIDAQHLDRRTNKRTLEELFYIYCCMYTNWIDFDKRCPTNMNSVIDFMIRQRDMPN